MWLSMTSNWVLYPLSTLDLHTCMWVCTFHICTHIPPILYSIFVPYTDTNIYIYTHSICIQYNLYLCVHVIISQRPWSFECDMEAVDEIWDVSWDLLVLKFCKTRVSLEGICPLRLPSDLWAPPNIPLYFRPEI